MPQLSDSHSSRSQRVYRNIPLTHSLSNQLIGWRPSHTNLLLFSPPTQDALLMAAGPRYIASARTTQTTPFPTALLLLRACLLRQFLSNDRCLESHYLATAIV
jgi:hypothetical protein